MILKALLVALGVLLAPSAYAECASGYTQITVPLCKQNVAVSNLPMDIMSSAGTPAVVGYSMNRALKSGYSGPLFQVLRFSDSTTHDIGIVNGTADYATVDSFCASTFCATSVIYDQGPSGLNLLGQGGGGNGGQPIEQVLTDGTHLFYMLKAPSTTNNGIALRPQVWYKTGTRNGGPNNGGMPGCANPTGSSSGGCGVATTQYWVVRGDIGNGGCCFDFGNSESTIIDDGNGHMFANKISTTNGLGSPLFFGPDVENGNATGSPALTGMTLATDVEKTDGLTVYTSKYGNSQSGTLTTAKNNAGLNANSGNHSGYQPMHLEGGITLAAGGDGSEQGAGAFFEGYIAAQQTSDATDNSVQANIVSFYGQSQSVGVQAAAANTFLDSVGVNTHIDQGYSETPYEAEFTYTGIRHARDGGRYPAKYITLYNNTISTVHPGVTTVLGVQIPPSTQVANGVTMANAGALFAFEGPNEPNNFPFTYNGVSTGDNTSWVGVAQFQRDLYAAVKADPVAKNFPVFNVSETGAEFDNVGLQCMILDSSCAGASAVTLMPAGTKYADYMNTHNYVIGNCGGGPVDNSAWNAADPDLNTCWDSVFSGWGVTWSKLFNGYPHGTIDNIPRVTTETGWGSDTIGLEPQARVFMNVWLSQFKRGFFLTAIYQMVDSQGGSGPGGLFDASNVAKPAATYMHNLTTVIADKTKFTPGTLAYTIPSEPAVVHDLLLQKANGTFYLIVWDERPMGEGTDPVTVNLGAAASGAVYDTTLGTSPVTTFANQSSVSLSMTDHPMIVRIGP